MMREKERSPQASTAARFYTGEFNTILHNVPGGK